MFDSIALKSNLFQQSKNDSFCAVIGK